MQKFFTTVSSFRFWIAFCGIILFAFFPLICFGERLPFKIFTTENGLPQNIVNRVIRDSNGFLWFCTEDGLSRFDGQFFTNYNSTNGLTHPQINHFLEAEDGSFWVANYGGGVLTMNNSPGSVNASGFVNVPIIEVPEKMTEAKRAIYLFQDSSETIWLGSFNGLFRYDGSAFQRVKLSSNDVSAIVRGIAEDENKNLWVWTRNGVFRRQPDGKTTYFLIHPSENYDPITQIFCDQKGKIYIAHQLAGLAVLDEKKVSNLVNNSSKETFSLAEEKSIVSDWYDKNNQLKENGIFSLFQSSDEHLWIGTATGITEFDGKTFQNYTKLQGLPETPYNWIAEDVTGNIWATTNQGAVKITRRGFVTYQQNEGIGVRGVRSIWENESGKLQVLTPTGTFHQLDQETFISAKPKLPPEINFDFPQNVTRDSQGELWVATKKGLFKFPKLDNFSGLAKIIPKKIKGLPSDFVMSVYEDSLQNMWISFANESSKLVKWERKTDTLYYFDEENGVPKDFIAAAFTQDSAGSLWFGNFGGGLLRYKNERFNYYPNAGGVDFGQAQCLFSDKEGIIWMGTKGGGIWKVSEANSEKPVFSQMTTKDGISSDNVTTIIEDAWGRIYLGTGRGIDWIDPKSKNIGHYSTVDGLNDNKIEISFRAGKNVLWFGTANSLAKFVPQPPRANSMPQIFITKIQVAGKNLPIPDKDREIEISSDESQIVIDFTGIDFASGQTLLFQHKLVGAKDEWSSPDKSRSVNFANLSAGSYQFAVRAVTSDGLTGENPVTFSFKILRPIYLRWWFLTLAALLIGLTVWQLYRFRIRRLLEIERTRTRIATDLHDDIGSDLSKISLLSEIVKMQMKGGNEENNRLLTKIAETSRNSVDSMRDIVWAINPSRDSLNDLVKKMRQFAEESLIEKNIKLNFNAPDDRQKLKISMDARRELYMIFKEAVSNTAKYSKCSEVEINFKILGKEISLQIKDNGKGFDISQDFEGNGLKNMKRRCETLKGKFEISSQKDNGTTISAKFPHV
jgi:signal transduction histidine kinase/sugar lactone lactonase YvrE